MLWILTTSAEQSSVWKLYEFVYVLQNYKSIMFYLENVKKEIFYSRQREVLYLIITEIVYKNKYY